MKIWRIHCLYEAKKTSTMRVKRWGNVQIIPSTFYIQWERRGDRWSVDRRAARIISCNNWSRCSAPICLMLSHVTRVQCECSCPRPGDTSLLLQHLLTTVNTINIINPSPGYQLMSTPLHWETSVMICHIVKSQPTTKNKLPRESLL